MSLIEDSHIHFLLVLRPTLRQTKSFKILKICNKRKLFFLKPVQGSSGCVSTDHASRKRLSVTITSTVTMAQTRRSVMPDVVRINNTLYNPTGSTITK